MRSLFPKYKTGELIISESKLNKKDKDILNKFLIYCGGTAGEKKLKNIKIIMLKIRDVSEIDYDKWDLDILRVFLALLNKSKEISKATKNGVKKVLKRFLKENYSDWSEKFKGLKDIKGENDMNQKKLNANTILTPEDLEKIIRKAESLKYKALIMLLYESGARPSEVLNLKWKDINLDKKEVSLFSTKNKTMRVNPIQESILHLKRYKQEYPFLDVVPNDYVFPSPNKREEPFSNAYFDLILNKLSKKAIGRNIYPYILRHTRATELQKKLPPKIYEKFMDHSIEMATRYSHLDKDDVREVLLEKVYHIEELTKEETDKIKRLEMQIEKIKKNFKSMMHFLNQELVEKEKTKPIKVIFNALDNKFED